MSLKYTIDQHGMGYVYLAKDRHLAAVETVSMGRFNIDLDYKGRPIGVELFDAKADSILADALMGLVEWINRP